MARTLPIPFDQIWGLGQQGVPSVVPQNAPTDLSQPKTLSHSVNENQLDWGKILRDFAGSNTGHMLLSPLYAMMDGSELTRKVMSGEVDPLSANAVGQSFNVASDLAGGGVTRGAVKPSLAPGVGIFGGTLAKTADNAALATAQKMESQGAPRIAILDVTGWHRGADDKWRFEIPDTNARLFARDEPKMQGLLSETLDHPDLFRAYPEFTNMPATTMMPSSHNAGAFYPSVVPSMRAEGKDPGGLISVLLHEAQHGVQGAEGFAAGSNPASFPVQSLAMDLARRQEAIPQSEFDKFRPSTGPMTIQDISNSIYWREAGETEARNVQKRWTNSLYGQPPWMTQEYPYSQQLIIRDGKMVPVAPPIVPIVSRTR